jgi:hypothetical protein
MFRYDRTNQAIADTAALDFRSESRMHFPSIDAYSYWSQDAYMIQRYGVVAPSAGKINRTYAKNALPDSTCSLATQMK